MTMWILPKNLSIFPYAQDMEGLISDLEELSELCAQSLMWRSKPFQSSTWLQRLKRVSWIQPLSSQTLKPSLGDSIVTKWTSSLEASLVSHLARPDEELEMKTLDTFGPISSEGSESWEDLPLFSLKTLKESSQANSKEPVGEIARERRFCFMSSVSWNDWVTTQRREHFRRLRSALHTKETEYLFLVSGMISTKAVLTSSIEDSKMKVRQSTQKGEGQSSTNGSRQESSGEKINWATPTARDFNGAYKGRGLFRKCGKHRMDTLSTQVTLKWSTPTSRDWKGHYPKESQEIQKRNLLPDQAHMETYQGELNPRWVEPLMGLPIGWTLPSCQNLVIVERMNSECLEMEWCQIQRLEHFESCLINWPNHKRLGDEFNSALHSVEGDQLIYDALSVIETVSDEYEQFINDGEMQNPYPSHTASEAAWEMALEDFMYNYEGYHIEGGPVYDYTRLESDE